MVNSIHTSRWLRPLIAAGWDVHLFPSTSVEQAHPALQGLTVHGLGPRPAGLSAEVSWSRLPRRAGSDWLRPWRAPTRSKAQLLARLVERLRPEVVHSMETQAAGYLTAPARRAVSFPPWLHSIWGSDLYLFGRLEAHQARIREVMQGCDALHVGCRRDAELAREAGFVGPTLDVIPGQGGFDIGRLAAMAPPAPASRRRHVAIKGYQGWAGRALVALRAVELVTEAVRGFRISVYSAAPEVELAAQLLAQRTGLAVEIVPPSSHEQVLRLHGQARASIGLSISDGVSNSLLEAMAMGSFPIQSETVCGGWVTDGVNGSLVHPEDPEAVAGALRRALADDALVDAAAARNRAIVEERLDAAVLGPRVLDLYRAVRSARRQP